MSIREDEKRWKRIQDKLVAEANGNELRPIMSQRTLFGIPSTVETVIERAVKEDEEARRKKNAPAPQDAAAEEAAAEDDE